MYHENLPFLRQYKYDKSNILLIVFWNKCYFCGITFLNFYHHMVVTSVFRLLIDPDCASIFDLRYVLLWSIERTLKLVLDYRISIWNNGYCVIKYIRECQNTNDHATQSNQKYSSWEVFRIKCVFINNWISWIGNNWNYGFNHRHNSRNLSWNFKYEKWWK